MRAAFGIDALVCQAKSFDGAAADKMLVDDLLGILWLDMAVPDGFRVDNYGRTMFALVEAAGLVDADLSGEPGGLGEHLELRNQLALAVPGAGRSRCALGADILTNEYVAFKGCQSGISSSPHGTCCRHGAYHRAQGENAKARAQKADQNGAWRHWTAIAQAGPLPSETMKCDLWKPIIS
jgi:hypothetical protein